MEVLHEMKTPCGCCTCQKLLTRTMNQSTVSRDSSPSAQHADFGTVSPHTMSSSGLHSDQALPTPHDMPPPLHGMPPRASSPKSSSYSTPRSTPCSSASATVTVPRSVRHCDRTHCDRTQIRSPVPRTVAPRTLQGTVDLEMRRIPEEAPLTGNMFDEDMRRAQWQQQHHRRGGGQSETRARTSVVPRSPMTPSVQGTRASLYVVENDHDEARCSEASTAKEVATGRLQQLMGNRKWWSPRRTK